MQTDPSWPADDTPRVPRLSDRHRAMLQEMGVPVWWPSSAVTTPQTLPGRAAVSVKAPAPAASRPIVSVPIVAAPPPMAGRGWPNMNALRAAVHDCTRCGLAQGRQRAVPGTGDLQPDWLIVGEAPGEEEDRQGLPFVGRAGQLLDRMLAAMGLTREHRVYIANVIKCRPPMNRNPELVEVAQCSPYLLAQIEMLRPKVIVAMGRFAAQTVLAEGGAMPADAVRQMPLGKLRGQVHHVTLGGARLPVIVTYHPAYLLRSPAEKSKAWADLCLALDTMDAQPSIRPSSTA